MPWALPSFVDVMGKENERSIAEGKEQKSYYTPRSSYDDHRPSRQDSKHDRSPSHRCSSRSMSCVCVLSYIDGTFLFCCVRDTFQLRNAYCLHRSWVTVVKCGFLSQRHFEVRRKVGEFMVIYRVMTVKGVHTFKAVASTRNSLTVDTWYIPPLILYVVPFLCDLPMLIVKNINEPFEGDTR